MVSNLTQPKGIIQDWFKEDTDRVARVFYCVETGAIGFTQGHLGIAIDISFEVRQLCGPAQSTALPASLGHIIHFFPIRFNGW